MSIIGREPDAKASRHEPTVMHRRRGSFRAIIGDDVAAQSTHHPIVVWRRASLKLPHHYASVWWA
jgi:hypothetical protein